MSKKDCLILPVSDSRHTANLRHFAITIFRSDLDSIKELIVHEEDMAKYEELVTKINKYDFGMMSNPYSEKFLREEICDFKRQIVVGSFRSWN